MPLTVKKQTDENIFRKEHKKIIFMGRLAKDLKQMSGKGKRIRCRGGNVA
jgi:hypothetical protein